MFQLIKEKERGVATRLTFASGDQRDGFQSNILGVTTARFQQSYYLRKKLNRVGVGKNIINVSLTDRHPRLYPGKREVSLVSKCRVLKQSYYLGAHPLTLKYYKGLVSQTHVAYL